METKLKSSRDRFIWRWRANSIYEPIKSLNAGSAAAYSRNCHHFAKPNSVPLNSHGAAQSLSSCDPDEIKPNTPSANKTLASDRFGCLTKFDRCICMGLSVAHPLMAVNGTKDPGRSIPPPEERRRSQHPADDRKWDERFTAEHSRPASMASSSASLFRLWMTGSFGAHTLP